MIYSIFREIFDRELLDICVTIRLLLMRYWWVRFITLLQEVS